jgi:hypothetical protein
VARNPSLYGCGLAEGHDSPVMRHFLALTRLAVAYLKRAACQKGESPFIAYRSIWARGGGQPGWIAHPGGPGWLARSGIVESCRP